ncbi:MAG: cobyrinic acid a,c-diamide synthase [Clostridia bacterium]|nr:MAG: cobyrinic acid a,c-diamide synthase [Clostridia bacterium]
MEYMIPRIVLAGTNSGCGKTTVACAILQALVNRELNVGAFKCGPDYIDPMFHSRIIGAECTNLDLFFFDENTLKYLLAKNGAGRDISVIEGVMGFYDGMGLTTTAASTYEVSLFTESPTVLVVAAKGASLSVMAVIQGFLDFCPNNLIKGVILNQCTASTYSVLAKEIEARFAGRVQLLGFLPTMRECSLESRHLGLITAAEVQGLHEKLNMLASQAERTIDIDGLLALAASAAPVYCEEVNLPKQRETVRIAVARDNAFCFYYEDSLDALREMGVELVPFSPLSNSELPQDIQGMYLGGGYPELYAQRLSENAPMRASVKAALERGVPCIAECGGFMYLTESIASYPMVGFIPGKSFDTGKLTRFGYISLKAGHDTLLCTAGGEIRGHEFHHWDSENTGGSFTAVKASGKSWKCVHATETLYAGYPHFHFYSNPDFAVSFYNACLKEKHKNDN